LRLLARREHSRAELARKLAPHAGSAQELQTLLDSLIEKKQLSDARYASERARWLARSTALRASATICARKASPKSWSRAPAPATTSSSRQALR